MRPEVYVTLDGSLIEEWLRPERGGPGTHSVAWATVRPGEVTHCHRHGRSDEAYYILQGAATVTVEEQRWRVRPRDAVLIPRGCAHFVEAAPDEPCVLLCICWPPYRHEDTRLCERTEGRGSG